ncbi:MAG: uracil-DNA glycosylase [Deltaproteobacteria bacterium]|nr:uracil-DNA glycosylase [Deltaproteobacteria bacterium]
MNARTGSNAPARGLSGLPEGESAAVADLLRDARAWLQEFAEEGVTSFAPHSHAAPSARAQAQTPSPARDAESTGAAPSGAEQPQSFVGAASGERPELAQVREQLGECTRCPLCEERTQIVFGEGNPDAGLMFIGEGPGEQEDLSGRPFVGRAGELLTAMIERGLEIPRAEVYICNIVKCRPPGNRTPLANEVAACRPFLDAQIAAVQPRVIVALGKPATSLLLGRDIAITRLRGQWHEYRGIPLMPTFHPAFILRQYTAQNRKLVWDDLRAALQRSREAQ